VLSTAQSSNKHAQTEPMDSIERSTGMVNWAGAKHG
jgi:hypothetical protein